MGRSGLSQRVEGALERGNRERGSRGGSVGGDGLTREETEPIPATTNCYGQRRRLPSGGEKNHQRTDNR